MPLLTLRKGIPICFANKQLNRKPHLLQIVMTTKLTILLTIVACLHVNARTDAQTIRFSGTDVSLKKVFSEIKAQTGYVFFYEITSIKNRRVTVFLKDVPIKEALDKCLENQDLTYEIENKTIIISSFPKIKNVDSYKYKNISLDSIPVFGTVLDEDGKPLNGASVSIKGTEKGTMTNQQGVFRMYVPNKSVVLVVSYVGFVSQEINLNGLTEVSVSLQSTANNLNDITVIGYGTQHKKDITGAISSLGYKRYREEPVTSFTQALQGRASGVQITNSSGAPGGNVKVRVRGASSLLGSNDPLYVVDGIILDIGIAGININDVENIEILKDAAATAIYGNRGANGVIIITTKQGKAGDPKIQVDINTGFSVLAKKYELMDAGTYAETVNYYKPNHFTAQQVADFKTSGGTDWQDEIFQTGITQNYQVSASGGYSGFRYFASANYLNQKGIVLRTSQKKYSIRSNISTHFGKKIKLDLNVFASRTSGLNNQDNGAKGSPTWAVTFYSPTFPLFASDGSYNRLDILSSPTSANPYMILKERYSDILSNVLVTNGKLSYNIVPHLTLDIVGGVNQNSIQSGTYANSWINPSSTSAGLTEAKSFYWQNSNILTYSRQLQDHKITITAVNEQSQNTYRSFGAQGNGISPISVTYNNLAIANTANINSSFSQFSLRSYIGRFGYNYTDRYYLTATFRADGTSKFQGRNKWGYFPSAAVAWKAIKDNNNSPVNNLKIRGSWGTTGNQGINPYATVASIGNMMNTYGVGQSYPGSIIVGVDNPDLKWETTAQTNAGFDIQLFKKKVNVSFDYFIKNTSDLLNRVIIPMYNGGGTVNKNIGKVQNRGFDFSLDATPVLKSNFKWETILNFSAVKNKVVSLGIDTFQLGGNYSPGLTQESPFAIKVGEPLGAFWGYGWEGIYKTTEAAKAAAYGFMPGDNKYTDWNNDGKIDSKDKHVIGYAQPKYTWGLNNIFTYKKFDLNVLLLGQYGNKMLNTAYAASATILSDATTITHRDGLNFWRPNHEDAKFANPLSSTSKNFIESTQFLENASFVKIKNIAIGYSFGNSLVKNSDIRLLLSVQNLKTFTHYKGYDPETSTSMTDSDGAIDVGAYPSSRTVTISLKATF
jgi:TonB-linked SusC/RagA family outer membrane protein